MNAALRPAAVLLALGLVLEARADDVGKRPLPDYKGRGDAPTTAGDVLIWVPRIALAPVYLVSEYVVRRPMKWAVINTEKTRWPFRLLDFLFDRPIGLVPTVLIDFGLRPTFGLYFFWNGLVVPEDDLRVTASGGPDVVTSTLADRLTLDGGVWRVTLRGHASSRSDNVFYGLGPESRTDDRARYEARRLQASLIAEWRFGALSRAQLEAGYDSVRFGSDSCCRDPSIADRVAGGTFAMPPGFAAGGYSGPFSRARLVLDSRPTTPAAGAALILDVEEHSKVDTGDVWLRSSATLGGSVDVTGHGRIVSLILHAAMAGSLTGTEPPFTEQVTLGGSGQLPGFLGGRLTGRSAVAATLEYEWPVWAYLVGIMHAGVGNVFGEHFEDVDLGQLRLSSGIGIRSVSRGDHRFELLVALGTEPFDRGGHVDSVRFLFGGVAGF